MFSSIFCLVLIKYDRKEKKVVTASDCQIYLSAGKQLADWIFPSVSCKDFEHFCLVLDVEFFKQLMNFFGSYIQMVRKHLVESHGTML